MEVELTFQGMSPCCSVSKTNVQVYLRVGFHCRAILTCENKTEAMYERSHVNEKLEPRSTIHAREIYVGTQI